VIQTIFYANRHNKSITKIFIHRQQEGTNKKNEFGIILK